MFNPFNHIPLKTPSSVAVAFLLAISIALSGYAIANNEELNRTKADNETIAQMLRQNQELLELYRLSQTNQQAELREMAQAMQATESALYSAEVTLMSRQDVLEQRQTLLTSDIVTRLERLSEQLKALEEKVNN